MPVTLNERLIAYLALFSGLAISLVAEFYSIIGFTAIFAAAQIPVIIMGIVLGVGKIAATLWLKQNWKIAHWLVRTYLLTAIAVLMGVTSMGIFGFLSKAHSDQSLVSGDVQSKIAVYDEKIKTAKENIDANRKALKQMDEAVDQVMARSSSETGADKAVALRRSQLKERARLQSEIQAEQKTINALSEERAPIAAEVRKVEAEVGPIKYIAQFVYGESDKDLLEKAVTWVIIILIVVFDPLAVILLLASQISFQNFRERTKEINWQERTEELLEIFDEEPAKEELKDDLFPTYEEITPTEGDSPEKESDVISTATVTPSQDPHPPGWMFTEPIARNPEKEMSLFEKHPYLNQPFAHFKNLQPMVHTPEETVAQPKQEFTADEAKAALIAVGILSIDGSLTKPEIPDIERPGDYITPPTELPQIDWNSLPADGYVTINGERMNVRAARDMYGPKHLVSNYVQNEEQTESGQWNKVISEQEYRLKLENDKNEPNNNTSNPT
jgi:hypothetical protein